MYNSFTIHWHFQCTIDTKTACIRKKKQSKIHDICILPHFTTAHDGPPQKWRSEKNILIIHWSYIEAYPNSIKHVLLSEKKNINRWKIQQITVISNETKIKSKFILFTTFCNTYLYQKYSAVLLVVFLIDFIQNWNSHAHYTFTTYLVSTYGWDRDEDEVVYSK